MGLGEGPIGDEARLLRCRWFRSALGGERLESIGGELDGTSSTAVYDPALAIFAMLAIYMRQWRL